MTMRKRCASKRVVIKCTSKKRLKAAWVKPLVYEVNIDETRNVIQPLINELVDNKASYLGTYEEAKDRTSLEIKIPQILKRGKKRVEKFEKKCGRFDCPLIIAKGKGDDIKE